MSTLLALDFVQDSNLYSYLMSSLIGIRPYGNSHRISSMFVALTVQVNALCAVHQSREYQGFTTAIDQIHSIRVGASLCLCSLEWIRSDRWLNLRC